MKEHQKIGGIKSRDSNISTKRDSNLSTTISTVDHLKVQATGSRPSNVSLMSVQSEYGETAFLNLHRY